VEEETGLYTARGLTRRLREVMADATRRHQPLACVVFLPEAVGGEAPSGETLTGLGAALRRVGRESDVLARLSQDAFVVVAPCTGKRERGGSPSGWPERSRTISLRWAYDFVLVSTAVEDASAAPLDEQELLARASGRARGGNGNGSHH
jgi:GGDEF domain-containing protein